MSLFQLGNFRLSSGAGSGWKLECDALTYDDWRCLAEMVRQMVGPFSSVEGVPRGGLALAMHLAPLADSTGPRLLVDDVLTTGGSMERARERMLYRSNDNSEIVGAVVFARGPCPSWIRPLFQMPECFWLSRPQHGGEM